MAELRTCLDCNEEKDVSAFNNCVKKVIVGNGRLVGAHFIEENQAAALMFDDAGVRRSDAL